MEKTIIIGNVGAEDCLLTAKVVSHMLNNKLEPAH